MSGKTPDPRPLADQRAEAEDKVDTHVGTEDFAEEHTPSPTDPPNAEPDAPGGEAEGHQPPT